MARPVIELETPSFSFPLQKVPAEPIRHFLARNPLGERLLEDFRSPIATLSTIALFFLVGKILLAPLAEVVDPAKGFYSMMLTTSIVAGLVLTAINYDKIVNAFTRHFNVAKKRDGLELSSELSDQSLKNILEVEYGLAPLNEEIGTNEFIEQVSNDTTKDIVKLSKLFKFYDVTAPKTNPFDKFQKDYNISLFLLYSCINYKLQTTEIETSFPRVDRMVLQERYDVLSRNFSQYCIDNYKESGRVFARNTLDNIQKIIVGAQKKIGEEGLKEGGLDLDEKAVTLTVTLRGVDTLGGLRRREGAQVS